VKIAACTDGRRPLFRNAFHEYAVCVVGDEQSHSVQDRLRPYAADILRVPYAYCYPCAYGSTSRVRLRVRGCLRISSAYADHNTLRRFSWNLY